VPAKTIKVYNMATAKKHLIDAIFNVDQAVGHLEIVENIIAETYLPVSLYRKVHIELEKLKRIAMRLENKSIRVNL
jgi:hypothetical protein